MRSILTLVFLILIFGISAVCAKDNEPSSLNETMTKIAETMVDVYPLVVAQRMLTPAEEKTLQLSIQNFARLFKIAQPQLRQKSSTYQVSLDLIIKWLANVERAFAQKNVNLGRRHLYSLGSICASCHTQDQKLRTLFSGKKRDAFPSDLSFAEFNYFTRNYSTAVNYYDRFLRAEKKDKTELDIITPLQRLITIYSQIYDTPDIAAKQLSEYRSLKSHTKKTQMQLDGWINGLKTLHQSQKKLPFPIKFQTLEKLVKKHIGDTDQAMAEFMSTPEDEVARVWLRGQLFHYLNTNPPKEEVPTILYWLSICDRSVAFDYEFSLADLYLKQCIVENPKHSYAKRCFTEYEKFVTIVYSGSGGVFIPPEIETELAELQDLLE